MNIVQRGLINMSFVPKCNKCQEDSFVSDIKPIFYQENDGYYRKIEDCGFCDYHGIIDENGDAIYYDQHYK